MMTSLFLLIPGNDNYYLIVAIIVILILLSPALILFVIGLILKKGKPKTAKKLFIIAGVYLLIGLGICGGTTLLA